VFFFMPIINLWNYKIYPRPPTPDLSNYYYNSNKIPFYHGSIKSPINPIFYSSILNLADHCLISQHYTMKPPFGRIGGKSRIAKIIINMFPPKYSVYVEPFFGVGHVFFEKKKTGNEVINDLDPDMYNVFKGIQEHGNYIETHIYRDGLTKSQFYTLKNKTDIFSLLLKYRHSFFNNGRSFNGSRTSQQSWRANFAQLQERLRGVQIFNEDYSKIIRHFDSPGTFFYLDPPYENSNDYSNSVKPEDIANVLRHIKGRFMLSYNDSPCIRNIFKDYNIQEIETNYSNNQYIQRRSVNELIITNY